MKVIRKFLKNGNISIVLTIPLLFGFLLLIGSAYIGQNWYPNGLPITISLKILAVCLLTACLSGYIQFYREEMPGYLGKPIHGKYPKIIGAITMLLSGLASIISLILSFK